MTRIPRLSPSRSWAVVRHEVRIFRRDPVFFAIFVTMPLLVMAFIIPAFRYLPSGPRAGSLSGAQQAVPGMALLFSLFLMGNVGFAFFREYGWNTWDRVRASCATPTEVMIGKVVVPLFQSAIQLAVLFGLGGVLFDLHIKGSRSALALLAVSFSISLVCLGLALLAICKTIMQLNAIANLGAIMLAGLGGAIVPTATLPGWARAVAPATPGYWAMRGFRNVILDGAGFGGVATSIGVLLAFSAAFAGIAALRFHFNDNKASFA